jgi:hypothetical protein
MTQLIVKSDHISSITPLIRAAIKTQLSLVATGIKRTRERLTAFEQKYGFSTEELLKQEHEGTLNDDELDIIEWLGEWRMLERLQDEHHELAEIEICS